MPEWLIGIMCGSMLAAVGILFGIFVALVGAAERFRDINKNLELATHNLKAFEKESLLLKDLVDMVEFLEAETSDFVMKDNIDPTTIKSINRILAKILKSHDKRQK